MLQSSRPLSLSDPKIRNGLDVDLQKAREILDIDTMLYLYHPVGLDGDHRTSFQSHEPPTPVNESRAESINKIGIGDRVSTKSPTPSSNV